MRSKYILLGLLVLVLLVSGCCCCTSPNNEIDSQPIVEKTTKQTTMATTTTISSQDVSNRADLKAEVYIMGEDQIFLRNQNTYAWHDCTVIANDYYTINIGGLPADVERRILSRDFRSPQGGMMRSPIDSLEIRCAEGEAVYN